MRTTVEGLLVVHEHGHPHVLLLQVANSFFKLPGDHLQPGEDETLGLQQRMYLRLGPESGGAAGEAGDDRAMSGVGSGDINDWTVGEPVGHFWRPNFETFMVSPSRGETLAVESYCRLTLIATPSTRTCRRKPSHLPPLVPARGHDNTLRAPASQTSVRTQGAQDVVPDPDARTTCVFDLSSDPSLEILIPTSHAHRNSHRAEEHEARCIAPV